MNQFLAGCRAAGRRGLESTGGALIAASLPTSSATAPTACRCWMKRRGCRQNRYDPEACVRERTRMRAGEFMSRTRTVVRPMAVTPTTCTPSHRKCSSHVCRRGSKSGVIWSDSGSIPVRLLPLCKLHSAQAIARFSESSRPPCLVGITCSNCSLINGASNSRRRQYSQRFPARWRTSLRTAASIGYGWS
jgi:hypothetical protein